MGENDKAAKILKTKEFAAFLIEIMNYLGFFKCLIYKDFFDFLSVFIYKDMDKKNLCWK